MNSEAMNNRQMSRKVRLSTVWQTATAMILLLAEAYVLFGWHLTKGWIIYPLYHTGSSYLFAVLTALGCQAVLAVWIIGGLGVANRLGCSGAIVFGVVSCVAGFYALGNFLSPLGHVVHVSSVRLGNQVYNLALQHILDAPAEYVLFRCDSLGWTCESVAQLRANANSPQGDQLVSPAEPTQLIADSATNTIYIQEGNDAIYEYHPHSTSSP